MSDEIERRETCEWEEDDYRGSGVFVTDCGTAFIFEEASTPVESDMRFCCFCGGRLIQKLREELELLSVDLTDAEFAAERGYDGDV